MRVYKKQVLFEAFSNMEEAKPGEEMVDLKKLFLLLAGEKNVVKQITMEEIADLFNQSSSLLHLYYDEVDNNFRPEKLVDYQVITRRAV